MSTVVISPQLLLNRLENPQDDFCVLDVRSSFEVEESHLNDARILYIPMQEIPAQMKTLSKEKDILVLCLSGARSWQVVQFLNANGFQAKNIEGGIQSVLFLQQIF